VTTSPEPGGDELGSGAGAILGVGWGGTNSVNLYGVLRGGACATRKEYEQVSSWVLNPAAESGEICACDSTTVGLKIQERWN